MATRKQTRRHWWDLPAISLDADGNCPLGVRLQADAAWPEIAPRLPARLMDRKAGIWRGLFFAGLRAGRAGGCVRYSRHSNGRLLLQVVKAAIDAGFFKEQRSTPGAAKMSRLKPTPKLTAALQADPYANDAPPRCFVLLRDRATKAPLPLDRRNPIAKRAQGVLRRVNEVNRRHRIEATVVNALDEATLVRLAPTHVAIYHSDWTHGRIYTPKHLGQALGHQSLSRQARATVTFDGEPAVELDFRGLHARLCYHLLGLEAPEDPYLLWGPKTGPGQRLLAKLAVNALLSARSQTAALAACNLRLRPKTDSGQWKSPDAVGKAIALRQTLQKTGLTFKAVIDRALQRHRPISQFFGADSGIKLMTIDAQVALAVLAAMAQQGVPCLAVHDSFLVPRRAAGPLAHAMRTAYCCQVGQPPIITGVGF